MKKRAAIIAVLALAVCALAVYGVSPALKEYLTGPDGPTELFVETCERLFSGDGDCRVFDEQGLDITEDFVLAHRGDYERGDFDALWEAFKAEAKSLSRPAAQDANA